jgi:L-iditol 2-dehydrogenase
VIRQSPLIDLLISHLFPMRKVEMAFALPVAGQAATVILNPWK